MFTVTITDFGNAATIGGDYAILATEIYSQVVGQMNFNMGAVVGILLLFPTILAFYLERVASQRQFGSMSDSAIPLAPVFMPRRDVPMSVAAWLIAALPITTVGIVIYGSFVRLWPYRFDLTLRHYDVKVAGGFDPLWMTIQISLMAGLIGTILLFALGFSLQRLPRHWVKPIYFLCLLPASVPGLVLGLAYIFAFNVPSLPLYALYGTATLLAICNVTHYWTQGFLTTMTGLRQVPATLEEFGVVHRRVASARPARRDFAVHRPDADLGVFLHVHALDGDAVGGDLPRHGVGERRVGVDHAPRRSRLRLAGGSLRGVHDGGGGGRIGADEAVSAVDRATSALDHPAEPGTEDLPKSASAPSGSHGPRGRR